MNSVFIGGGNNASNGQVSIDLSGSANQVDAAGLGLATTSVAAGGTELTQGTANTVRLDAPGATFLATAAQTFTLNVYSSNGGAQTHTISVGGSGALTEAQVLSSLNSQLSQYGISASVGSDGQIELRRRHAFHGQDRDHSRSRIPIATAASAATNTGVYEVDGAGTYAGEVETLTFQNGQGTANVSLLATDTLASALSKINAQTASLGIYAITNAAGTRHLHSERQ